MLPVRLLIIAADPLARTALAALLRAEEGVIVAGQAAASDDLAEACAVYRPDVLLWDTGWDGAVRLEELAADADTLPPILAIGAQDASAQLWAAGCAALWGAAQAQPHWRQGSPQWLTGWASSKAPPNEESAWQQPIMGGGRGSIVEPLTPREMDVLGAMADGLSNKLIAAQAGH